MKKDLFAERFLTDSTIKVGVAVWIILALLILFMCPVKSVAYYYPGNPNMRTLHVSSISGEIQGDRKVSVDLELFVLDSSAGEISGKDIDLLRRIAKGRIDMLSSLPLSTQGFKNIVRSDMALKLKQAGILGQRDQFVINVSLR